MLKDSIERRSRKRIHYVQNVVHCGAGTEHAGKKKGCPTV